MKRFSILLQVFIWLSSGFGEERGSAGSLAFYGENDLFAGSDGDYTNGVRLAWLSPIHSNVRLPLWAAWLSKPLPGKDTVGIRYGWSLQHEIYTPGDIDTQDLVLDDRPYAGWLGVGLSVHQWSAERVTSMELSAGVLGPWAFGEEIQREAHRIEGTDEPQGWENQLVNEPTANLGVSTRWRFHPVSDDRWGWDVVPELGFDLGNRRTRAHGSVQWRFGYGLPWGCAQTRISPTSYRCMTEGPGRSLYAFLGAAGSAVAHDATLNGNTFRDSHAVDPVPWVGEGFAGVGIRFGDWSLSYTHSVKSQEFEGQGGAEYWGSVAMGWTSELSKHLSRFCNEISGISLQVVIEVPQILNL